MAADEKYPHTARTQVDDPTDAALDSEADSRDVDRAHVIREILHAWARQRDEWATLYERRRRAQGHERADDGTSGPERAGS